VVRNIKPTDACASYKVTTGSIIGRDNGYKLVGDQWFCNSASLKQWITIFMLKKQIAAKT
jgi:hypothetical protein